MAKKGKGGGHRGRGGPDKGTTKSMTGKSGLGAVGTVTVGKSGSGTK